MNGAVSASVSGSAAPASASPAAPPRFDFPGWMPPMLVKELRQGLRQRGFVGGLIAAQAVLVILFITGFATDTGDGVSLQRMIDGVFWCTLFATLLLVAPLRALAALHTEMDARTMDLLLLTRLDSWRIVWGKWVSLMVQTVLLVAALLPYAVVRYFFGSVDLLRDFEVIATLLGMSAVFTAAGLWASGMNRVLRMLLVIGVLIGAFSMFVGIMGRAYFMSGGFIVSASAGPVSLWLTWAIWIWCGASLLTYFLMMAVRWFAPLAENHAVGPRLMPFVLACPLLAFWAGAHLDNVAAFAAAWLVVTGVVALLEFASARELMAIHLRGRAGRPGWWGALGAAFLPGWPSAALWAADLIGATLAVWCVVDFAMPMQDLRSAQVAWLAVLAWAGLVFPALLVALIPSLRRAGGVLYFVMHALLGIFAVMAGSSSLSRRSPILMQTLDWISHAVPTTSFWHAINEFDQPSELPAVEFGQALGVALTLALMLRLARPYWTNVRAMRRAAAGSGERE